MLRPRLFSLSILCAVLAGAFALSFAAAPAPVAADDFKDLQRQYDEASRFGSGTKMKRIVGKIADVNTVEAAEFLLDRLAGDQKARKQRADSKNPDKLPSGVRDAIVEALSRFTNEEAVGMIGEMALALKSDREPTLALDQFDYFKALAGMNGIDPAEKTLRQALSDDSNPYVKVAAVEAIRQAKAGSFIEDVAAILREDNEDWANKWLIVPINVLACLEDIVIPSPSSRSLKASLCGKNANLPTMSACATSRMLNHLTV